MKTYNYEAHDRATNKVIKSTLQADSESTAAKLLVDQGFSPIKISEKNTEDSFFVRISNRIKTKDKVVFTRQLATLVGAGLPLVQSLNTVLQQTQNKKMQSIIQEIVVAVEGGKTLSSSFSKYPDIFNPVFLALVGAGEISGTLDEALFHLADQQEKDANTVSKIRGAMVYPIIVLVVILGVMIFMLLSVVPQVEKLYVDLNKELPILTQIMVNAANFLVGYWWLMMIIIGVGTFFLVQFLKTESGISIKDNFKLKVPIFGKMFQKVYMGRFMRSGQTLLRTGVAMLDMLKITSKAVNNVVVEKSINNAAEKVKGGKALSDALQPEPFILTLVPQMVKIGEQSGKIDDMMGKAAQVYEDEIDEQVRTISTAIEPVLMVLLAVVAGGMIAAILLPIYGLVGGVNVG